MTWILGSFRKDLGLLYLPGFAVVILLKIIGTPALPIAVLTFVITALIDSGHTYATLWRTLRRPSSQSDEKKYALFALMIFTASWLWMRLGLPHFWTFVVYSTIFHHVRQSYGLHRWYQSLARERDAWTGRLLQVLLFLPFLALHFRPARSFGIYTVSDIPSFPSWEIWNTLRALWNVTLLLFLCREYLIYLRTQTVRTQTLFSVLMPSLLQWICVFANSSKMDILFPLLVSHGVAYIVLIARGRQSLGSPISLRMGIIFVGISAVVGGLLSFGLEQLAIDFNYIRGKFSFWNEIVLALIATPMLWHYLVDAFIWKHTDEDMRKILSYSKQSTPP